MNWPVKAGAFNHRAEAWYRADAKDRKAKAKEKNPIIARLRETGLRAVPVLHWAIPPKLWAKLITLLNQYHRGSGVNLIDYLKESLELEAEWKADCSLTHCNLNNPKYHDLQKAFMLKSSASSNHNNFFTCWEHLKDCMALAHLMTKRFKKFDFFNKWSQWLNSHMDFLRADDSMAIISSMHQLSLILLGNLRKYWPDELVSIILMEAFKFCAGPSARNFLKRIT